MQGDMVYQFLIGLGGLIAAIAGVTIGVWKWDARRIEVRAAEDLRRADERAKEREHELKLAALQIQQEAEERERQMQANITQLQQQVIAIQQTVETRLFTALDVQHGTNRDLTTTIQAHIQAVNDASTAQLGAIQALSQDVAGLKDQLSTEYKAILEQASAVHRMVGDLVTRVATYHESVTKAIESQVEGIAS